MDYILFHSQYSPSSKKLFDEFPNLMGKSVSVDSVAMRSYVKKLHIVCVPTLLLLIDNKPIDKIVGYDKIYNWLLITIYRSNQLQKIEDSIEEPDISQDIPNQTSKLQNIPNQSSNIPIQNQIQEIESIESNQTSLDDLVLVDEPQPVLENRNEPKVPTKAGGSTLSIAEALKKERDNDLETNNKKRMSN